jgi:two-component system, NtrC family, response regulator AtoC
MEGMTMEPKVHILIVDDEEIVRESLAGWLGEDGYDVGVAENGARALERLPEKDWNLAMVDLKMPGMDGIELMDEIRKAKPETIVIIMTAYATVDTAVQAMKKGAYDYIVKPFNPEDLSMTIRKIIEHQKLVKENIYLRKELKKQYRLHDLVSKNHKMVEIFELVKTVAKSNSIVLVQGESGTGKELLSRAIHMESPRRDAPFVTVSCASLTETLLESELFGHEKGAFTGADQAKSGKIELAKDGTLFLDEIGDISLKLQMDLLRVIEQREFRRVGGTRLIPITSRIIGATNRDLAKAIEEGKFREDLYYRLNVISVHIPPLRERKEDIPLLVEHFLDRFNIEMGKNVDGLAESAMRLLMDYGWPGNARELRNVIERAMVVTKGRVILDADLSLPQASGVSGAQDSRGKSLSEMEKEHIRQVLAANRWNIVRSAQVLGIDRVTLYNKIRKYELKKEPVLNT